MRFFGRRSTRSAVAGPAAQEWREALAHLEEFARSRPGVEAYLEPATAVTPRTVMLIAASGEWTRRRVANPAALQELTRSLALPVYDVQLVGYPNRMREWNRRHRPPRG